MLWTGSNLSSLLKLFSCLSRFTFAVPMLVLPNKSMLNIQPGEKENVVALLIINSEMVIFIILSATKINIKSL